MFSSLRVRYDKRFITHRYVHDAVALYASCPNAIASFVASTAMGRHAHAYPGRCSSQELLNATEEFVDDNSEEREQGLFGSKGTDAQVHASSIMPSEPQAA